MNFKKLLLVLPSVAVMSSGCVTSDSPIVLLNNQAVDAQCAIDNDVSISQGSLDLSVGVGYIAHFAVESNLQAVSTVVDGDVVSGPDQNDFVVERVDIEYSNPAGGAAPAAATLPIHFVIRAGASAENTNLGLNLLPAEARAALAGVGSAGTIVVATVSVTGSLRSGRTFTSNEVNFPIEVFESGFSGCGAGEALELTGPCGSIGAQDGTFPVCVPVTP